MANEERETLNHKEEVLTDLKNPRYRRGFVEGHAKDTIAFQLRALRKQKQWEQRDVAKRLGNAKLQPMISRYENPDYGRYSITTLLELASVFDVALVVRLAPFSELLEWDWSSGPETMCPASFNGDERLMRIAAEIRSERRNLVNAGQTQQPIQLGALLENKAQKHGVPPLSGSEGGQRGSATYEARLGTGS